MNSTPIVEDVVVPVDEETSAEDKPLDLVKLLFILIGIAVVILIVIVVILANGRRR